MQPRLEYIYASQRLGFVVNWNHKSIAEGGETRIDKRIKPLLESLESQGWHIKPSRKGWMCYPPDKSKQAVAIHKTPSDGRWYQNCLSRLRNSGYIQ